MHMRFSKHTCTFAMNKFGLYGFKSWTICRKMLRNKIICESETGMLQQYPRVLWKIDLRVFCSSLSYSLVVGKAGRVESETCASLKAVIF